MTFVDLGSVPTLEKYLARVGAEPKSFRRYAIETFDGSGYRRETGSVSVDGEGNLKLWGQVEPPTKEEAAAIKNEVAQANWPRPKPGPKRDLPAALKDADPDSLFPFLTPDGGHILFLQQRIDGPDGKKYLPWSYWSDDQWRNTEPDGLLPLYGLDKIGNHSTVFIHEGAKAPRHCQWLAAAETQSAKAALAAHPWGREISAAAHVGWAGGAPNPHRTDWSALRRAGVKHIYMVADNDHEGQKAVSKVSRLTLLRMSAVMFDDSFKPGFDLADQWPSGEKQPDWWNGKRYLGPGFHDLCVPATWATYKIETEGRPAYGLRDDFLRQWALSKEPHLFAHRDHAHLLLTPEVFNRTVAPYADAEDVARLLAKYVPPHADGITYTPHSPTTRERILTKDGRRLINTYRPPTIKAAEGNVMPFLRFMTHLFPDKKDRFLVMRWVATLIARPKIRMRYSLLLISETQGVGKTTLSDAILKPLVGPWNVSMPTEQMVTDNAFNSWRAHKRLAIINEIYSGERRKCYDRLKSVTSDDEFDVNKKFMEPYSIENYLHVVACSNSMKAIHLDDTDRRFLVPAVTEKLMPKQRWEHLYKWINSGGLSAIAYWADRFVNQHGPVATSDRAPDTSRKREVIAGMRSEGAQLAYDLAEVVKADQRKIVLRLDDVRGWVAKARGMETHNQKLESLLTLRKAMMAAGLTRPERRDNWDGRISINRRPTEVVANFNIVGQPMWESTDGAKDGLAAHYMRPDDFMTLRL